MTQTSPTNPATRSTRKFVRHYVQMVVVMFAGMFALMMPADALFGAFGASTSSRHPAMMLLSMGVTMTVPMVAWMRYRGHAWRPTNEMAASMLIPTLGTMTLAWTGAMTGTGPLMVIEHVAMLSGMLAVMLLRRDDYSRAGHSHGAAQYAIAA